MTTPSIQQLLADALLQHFPSAEVKKINKDNYVDIHLPWVHPKRGTHLGFNTAGGTIKIVFYCREEEFVQQAQDNGGGLLEKYSQGIRLKGNPEFSEVKSAIAAAVKFIEALGKKSVPSAGGQKSKSEKYTFDQAVNAYLQGDMDYVVAYVQAGNPVLQFNGDTLITNELIAYVCTYMEVDQRIVDLVDTGVDLDASFDDGEGYTAAHFAAWDGKDEILAYLLKAGAKADVVGEDGYTPLFLAAAGGHLACAKILVESGVDINRRLKDDNIYFGKQGGTPLTLCFINGFLDMALFLIEQGADPFVLVEPCKGAPSPNLFVNFLSLVQQCQISAPAEGQLSKILSLVGLEENESLNGVDAKEEAPESSGQLDLNEFLKELDEGAKEELSSEEESEEEDEINLDELIKKFVEKHGEDYIMDLLYDYLEKGQIVVVEISAFDLIKTLSSDDFFGKFISIAGTAEKGDLMWSELSDLIGESESAWVKEEFKEENPDSIVLLYCGGKYVYAFSNPISHNENSNAEDSDSENAGLFDLNEFVKELDASDKEETEAADSEDGLDLASFLEGLDLEVVEDDASEESGAEEEGGFPLISYRKPAEELVEVVQQYFRRWQKSSQVYARRMGIKAFIPDFVASLASDKVCPIFTSKEIETICSRIKSEKIIPILGYVPEEFYGHTKHVWWLVPFCIWKENVASLVFIDKNGFYAMYSQDGEEEIDAVFNWDSVDELDFEYAYDGDPNVNRLTLTQEDGNFLTFDEFVSTSEEDDHGSYLAVIEAIWEARRETIEASKGEPFWAEGAGGEGFIEFETPQDLLKPANWDNPNRPDPSMFGG
jgi:hypothetical protein